MNVFEGHAYLHIYLMVIVPGMSLTNWLIPLPAGLPNISAFASHNPSISLVRQLGEVSRTIPRASVSLFPQNFSIVVICMSTVPSSAACQTRSKIGPNCSHIFITAEEHDVLRFLCFEPAVAPEKSPSPLSQMVQSKSCSQYTVYL
jgi:hypothetical protein